MLKEEIKNMAVESAQAETIQAALAENTQQVAPDYITAELGTDNVPMFDPATVGDIELTRPVQDNNSPATTETSRMLRVNVEGTTYVARDNKLYVESVKGEKTYTYFVSSLIVIVAKARDTYGKSWGKVIRFADGDGIVKEIYIRNSEILTNGKGIINQLSEDGLVVSSNAKMIEMLLQYLNLAPPMVEDMAICTERTGWHGYIYLFSDNSFIGNSETCVVYTGASTGIVNSVKGTVLGWRDNVAAICKFNSMLIFSICIAFASVLLRLLKVESGGYHFFGASSGGKSTTLFVGASVQGDPEQLVGSWNSTAVGLEYTAQERNDSLMILDELHEANEKVASTAGYSLLNPKGKTRGLKAGGAKQGAERRLNCLSSGEQSYADFIRESGKDARAGQAVRFNDIPAEMGVIHEGKNLGVFENIHGMASGQAFAEHIKRVASEYYGTPIRTFLEKLVGYNPDDVLSRYQTITEDFFSDHVPAQADSQVRRVATKYAVAALAGELATGMGITGWDEFDAYNAVGVVFKKWLDNRGTIGQQEPERAVEQVRNFLLRHGMTTRFMLVKRLPNGHFEMELPERQHNNLAGYRYANAEGNHEFIVLPEAFRDEMCTGLTAKNVTQTLKDRGYLQVEGNDNIPQVRRLLPGMDRYMRVYHFYPSILGDGDVLQAEVENENQQ